MNDRNINIFKAYKLFNKNYNFHKRCRCNKKSKKFLKSISTDIKWWSFELGFIKER